MSIKGTGTSTLPKTDMVPSKRSFFITALDGSNSYRTVARHKRIKQMIILTSLGMRSYQSKKSFIQREFSSNYFLPAIFLKVSECDTPRHKQYQSATRRVTRESQPEMKQLALHSISFDVAP